MTLPYDMARCNGYGNDEEGWREGCEDCLRRADQGGEPQWFIQPPPIITFQCEYLIEK